MIVLDTQAWIWWVHKPERLSAPALRAIRTAERGDGLVVSVISVWEIAVKTQLGKLELFMDLREWYRLATSCPNLRVEPLFPPDAMASAQLPGDFHKDPADRIVVAVARRLGAPLATSDRRIQDYQHVQTVW